MFLLFFRVVSPCFLLFSGLNENQPLVTWNLFEFLRFLSKDFLIFAFMSMSVSLVMQLQREAIDKTSLSGTKDI